MQVAQWSFESKNENGYFETENKGRGAIVGSSYNEKAEIYAIPIITNVKGIVPFKYGEIFLGVGFVGYYVNGELDVGPYSASDDDYIFGGQILGGLNFDINEGFFLGLEGKYIITQDAELANNTGPLRGWAEFNLNGFIATGVLGFRF